MGVLAAERHELLMGALLDDRAERSQRALQAGHRLHADRSLWPDRDLARGMHQPDGSAGLQRLHRPAYPVHRCLRQGRER